MKTIVNETTGRKDFPIFDGNRMQIFEWVKNNLFEFENYGIEVNEPHSCSVKLHSANTQQHNLIEISGDEDLISLRIVEVDVINLKK